MSIRFYLNSPATALAASVSNSQTSVTVNSATGYPIQFPFTIIVDRGTATEEAMSVTAAAGAVFTVTRAIDGTTAFAHATGAVVEHGITAQDIREPNAHINASTAVHGLAGAVVGTTDVQAVSNKDLTSGTNTFPSSLATLATVQVFTNKDLSSGTNTFPAALATLTGVQTLTNKTLTNPKINTILDTNGQTALNILPVGGTAANWIEIRGASLTTPAVAAVGGGVNVNLNLVSKGTGLVMANGIGIPDLSTAQTLTNKTLSTGTFVGASTTDISGAWGTWVPTWVGLTVGNGTVVARYQQIGKTVHFSLSLVFGTTTAVSAGVTVSVPVAALSTELGPHSTEIQAVGSAVRWVGEAVNASTTTLAIFQPTSSTNVTLVQFGTVGLTLGSGSRLVIRGTYEAA